MLEDVGKSQTEKIEAMKHAEKIAQQRMMERGGPKLGEVVTHPSDPRAYAFQRAEGAMGIVSIPAEKTKDGKEIVKQFPLNELYSPLDDEMKNTFGAEAPETAEKQKQQGLLSFLLE